VRRALVSVAVGLAGAAGVTASGWALQAGALPPPTSAARVAADASAWLHDYRLTVDVFHVDHRRIKGACLRGWFRARDGRTTRGSALSLRPEPVLIVSGHRVAVLSGHRSKTLPVRLLAAAGCAGKLAPRLAGAAQAGSDFKAERSYAANQPAIKLKLEPFKHERLTLYVSPRTFRPLVAIVDVRNEEATARLYLNRVKPRLLARFHLLRTIERRPRP
jgi:hypothetical protein